MQGARYTQSDVCGVGNEVTVQLKFESDKLTLVTKVGAKNNHYAKLSINVQILNLSLLKKLAL